MRDKDAKGSGEQMVFDKTGKHEPCNIGAIRKKLDLKQIDFAKMAGLTSALLSEVEHGKKQLTDGSAKKLAAVLNKLINEPGKSEYQIDPTVLSAGHFASFYPKELQSYIMELLMDLSNKRAELDFVAKRGEIPDDATIKKLYDNKNLKIMTLLESRRKTIQNNLSFFVKSEEKEEPTIGMISYIPKF